MPIEKETTKQFVSDLFRSSPPFSLIVKLPQTGYASGQTIDISATVANNSSVTINSVKFTLCKTITYISSRPRNKKRRTVVLQKQKESGVSPRSKGNFQAELYVPSVAPSNTISKVITIEYWVNVEAKASGPHFSPSVRIPITIGTVQLTEKEEASAGYVYSAVDEVMPTFPANPPILMVYDAQAAHQRGAESAEGAESLEAAGGAPAYPWDYVDRGKYI